MGGVGESGAGKMETTVLEHTIKKTKTKKLLVYSYYFSSITYVLRSLGPAGPTHLHSDMTLDLGVGMVAVGGVFPEAFPPLGQLAVV